MTIDRASVEEGLRRAAEAMKHADQGVHVAVLWRPSAEHYAELARDWLRLKRVEEAVREEHICTGRQRMADFSYRDCPICAALANPAAEKGE